MARNYQPALPLVVAVAREKAWPAEMRALVIEGLADHGDTALEPLSAAAFDAPTTAQYCDALAKLQAGDAAAMPAFAALVGAHASGFPATRLRIPMVNGQRDYYRRIESYLWRLLDGSPILLPDGGTTIW